MLRKFQLPVTKVTATLAAAAYVPYLPEAKTLRQHRETRAR